MITMNWEVAREFISPFMWLNTVTKSIAKRTRDELQDLLTHCSQTMKSYDELTKALYKIDEKDFTQESFFDVFSYCGQNYTGQNAARQARSHCTDIKRDINRIEFKLTKLLRTENMNLSSLNEAFSNFANADDDFLMQFEDDMSMVDKELTEIFRMIKENPHDAWFKYEQLRSSLFEDRSKMNKEYKMMRQAEDHIRGLLT